MFLKKHFVIGLLGISLFLISTITFEILGVGNYYVENIKYHLLTPSETRGIDFMSLDALIRYSLNISTETVKYIKFFCLLIIYLMALKKSTHILTVIFLLTVYFLFFYDLVFQYHFSVLGPLLAICVLVLPQFQTKIARVLILIINLPNIFFILRFLKAQIIFDPIYGPNPTMVGWQVVSFFQILPIIFLVLVVLTPIINDTIRKLNNIKPLFK